MNSLNPPDKNSPDFRDLFPVNDDDSCGLTATERDETIEKYLAKALSEHEIDAFDEHTFYCETCFRALQFHEEMVEALAQKAEVRIADTDAPIRSPSIRETLKDLVRRIRSYRYLPLALGATMTILAVAIGISIWQQPDSEANRRLFAANSQEYPLYERLIGSRQRAGGITVQSPKNGFNCRDDLVFAWEGESGLSVKIFSNEDSLLHTFFTADSRYVFENAAGHLPPGLYYWKLEDEQEMKYLGKFFVNKPE